MANRLTLLVAYTVVTTIGCLAVPMAFTLDLGLGVASVGIATVFVLGVAMTYRDIAKDLSMARQPSFSTEFLASIEAQANKPE
jgi:ABC-type transport system involved in cytochrome bd biosynthesis fused ATPase/permease subunit